MLQLLQSANTKVLYKSYTPNGLIFLTKGESIIEQMGKIFNDRSWYHGIGGIYRIHGRNVFKSRK